MAKRSTAEDVDIVTLLGNVVRDAEKLLGQQIDLLRAEVGQELQRAGGAGAKLAAGGGLAAAGGLLSGFMLAHLLHRTTRLPLWCCLGAVGGAFGAAGVALLRSGRQDLGEVQLLPPPQTAAAVKENVAWLKHQLTPAAP